MRPLSKSCAAVKPLCTSQSPFHLRNQEGQGGEFLRQALTRQQEHHLRLHLDHRKPCHQIVRLLAKQQGSEPSTSARRLCHRVYRLSPRSQPGQSQYSNLERASAHQGDSLHSDEGLVRSSRPNHPEYRTVQAPLAPDQSVAALCQPEGWDHIHTIDRPRGSRPFPTWFYSLAHRGQI